jgi:hypothetical protein
MNDFKKIKQIHCITFIFLFSIFSCTIQKQIRENRISYTKHDFEKDSVLVNSFIMLDSIVKSKKSQKVFYCPVDLLKIIVNKTQIQNSGSMGFIGPQFILKDWIAWHEWFKNKFRKGITN